MSTDLHIDGGGLERQIVAGQKMKLSKFMFQQ